MIGLMTIPEMCYGRIKAARWGSWWGWHMDRDVGGQTTINLLRRFRGALSPICNHYKHVNELGGTESWNLQSTSCRHHAMYRLDL